MNNQIEVLVRTLAGAAILGLFGWTYGISNKITRVETIQDKVVEHTAQIDDNERDIIRMQTHMNAIDHDLEEIKEIVKRTEDFILRKARE